MDKIVNILLSIVTWIINPFPKRISKRNIPVRIRFEKLPNDEKWFFNKYPYKIKIYLNNKTNHAFYIDSMQIMISKQKFDVMEFAAIKNDITPRSRLNFVSVQANEANKIEGIVEVGYGFDFEKAVKSESVYLIIRIGKTSLKYKYKHEELFQ